MISLCISAWTCHSQPGLGCPRYPSENGVYLLPLHLLDPVWSLQVSSIHSRNRAGGLNLLLDSGVLLVCLGDTPQCSCTCSTPEGLSCFWKGLQRVPGLN